MSDFTPPLPVKTRLNEAVEEGRIFQYTEQFTLTPSGVLDILIQVGDKKASVVIEATVNGQASLEAFEDTTFSDAGNAKTFLDLNRVTSNTAASVITEGPTITVVGASLGTRHVAAGSKNNQTGGDAATGGTVLPPSSTYLIRITDVSGAENTLSVSVFIGEER